MSGGDGVDTALARALLRSGVLDAGTLRRLLDEVRSRRALQPGVGLAGVLVESGTLAPGALEPFRSLLEERRLGGYRLEEEVGRGGMGSVWRATQVETGAVRAVKVLPSGWESVAWVERFRREAAALGRLDHPHVVRVHAASFEPGEPAYLVQDLLTGGSLQDRLEAGGPLEVEASVRLAAKLAEGLGYVHARGVLHRDLKPANVLFDEQGSPKLVDFGLAQTEGASQALTKTGDLLGTPVYMAPEQVEDARQCDERTDVYGLGAVLFAALTGVAPVEASGGSFAVLDRVLRGEVRSLRRERPEVPRWLERVVLKALARDPRRRYGRAVELARALREQGQGEGGRRAVWGALVLALVLGGVGLGVWLQGEELRSSGEVEVDEGERVRGAGSLAEVEAVEGWWGEAVGWARLLDAGESSEGLERWLGAPAEDAVVRALLEGRRAYVEGEVVSLEEWAEAVRWEEAVRWAEEARGRRLAAQESWGAARKLISASPALWAEPEQSLKWREVHELWDSGAPAVARALVEQLPTPSSAEPLRLREVVRKRVLGELTESLEQGPELLLQEDEVGVARWVEQVRMVAALEIDPSGEHVEVALLLTDLRTMLGQLPHAPLIEAVAEWFWDDAERMSDLVLTGQRRGELAPLFLRLLERTLELGVSEREDVELRVAMLYRSFRELEPQDCVAECDALLRAVAQLEGDPVWLAELEAEVLLVEGRCWIELEDYAAAVEALEESLRIGKARLELRGPLAFARVRAGEVEEGVELARDLIAETESPFGEQAASSGVLDWMLAALWEGLDRESGRAELIERLGVVERLGRAAPGWRARLGWLRLQEGLWVEGLETWRTAEAAMLEMKELRGLGESLRDALEEVEGGGGVNGELVEEFMERLEEKRRAWGGRSP